MSEAILELRHVFFAYEDQPDALQDISTRIEKGERVAVIGGNGAGKSTFFLCCNGVLTPRRGELLLGGKPVGRGKRELNRLREQVGIVFQDPNTQIIGSTVESEISFGPMNLGLGDDAVEERIEDALAAMNLETLRLRPPHYLSGGEKKRLSIADVLAMRPEIILLDEPTASLDVANTETLEQTLGQLARDGKTLLVSTHDIEFAWRWATRVLAFHRSRLVADGPAVSVLTDEETLGEIGMKPPVLYRITRMLQSKGMLHGDCEYPRCPEDLQGLL